MAFTNARREMESRIPYPEELEVMTDRMHDGLAGYYGVVPDQTVNDYPVWTTEGDKAWLYSTPQGYWRITNDPADFQDGRGFIISRDKHGGLPPNTVSQWYSGSAPNPAIVVKLWGASTPLSASPQPHRQASASASPSPRSTSVMGPVDLTLSKHATEKLGMIFAASGLELVQVRDDGAAIRYGVDQYIGWALTHVNGQPVHSTKELVERTAGATVCSMRLLPPASFSGIPSDWDGKDEKAYLVKGITEPMGLQLQDMVLVAVQHGSPGHRCGLQPLVGRRLLHVNGHGVRTMAEVQFLTKDTEQLVLGFERLDDHIEASMSAEGPDLTGVSLSRSPPPQGTNPTSDIPVMKHTQAPLGCWFDIVGGQLQLRRVMEGSMGEEAGLGQFLGWSVQRAADVPVTSPEDISEQWANQPVGGVMMLKLEERHIDRHLRMERSYSQFVEAYGPNADREWIMSRHSTLPVASYRDWQQRRSEQRSDALYQASHVDPLPNDGAYMRRALGLPAAAGRGSGSPPPRMRPTFLGPAKS